MRYQDRYPKTMSGAEIRILNRWADPVKGLEISRSRSSRSSRSSLSEGQIKRFVNRVRDEIENRDK